jgi:hypothetical protein
VKKNQLDKTQQEATLKSKNAFAQFTLSLLSLNISIMTMVMMMMIQQSCRASWSSGQLSGIVFRRFFNSDLVLIPGIPQFLQANPAIIHQISGCFLQYPLQYIAATDILVR